jgi:hypothetical protein
VVTPDPNGPQSTLGGGTSPALSSVAVALLLHPGAGVGLNFGGTTGPTEHVCPDPLPLPLPLPLLPPLPPLPLLPPTLPLLPLLPLLPPTLDDGPAFGKVAQILIPGGNACPGDKVDGAGEGSGTGNDPLLDPVKVMLNRNTPPMTNV